MEDPIGPLAWVTDESLERLRRGGNGARGTVPMHAHRSRVACNAVFAEQQLPHEVDDAIVTQVSRAMMAKPREKSCTADPSAYIRDAVALYLAAVRAAR